MQSMVIHDFRSPAMFITMTSQSAIEDIKALLLSKKRSMRMLNLGGKSFNLKNSSEPMHIERDDVNEGAKRYQTSKSSDNSPS